MGLHASAHRSAHAAVTCINTGKHAYALISCFNNSIKTCMYSFPHSLFQLLVKLAPRAGTPPAFRCMPCIYCLLRHQQRLDLLTQRPKIYAMSQARLAPNPFRQELYASAAMHKHANVQVLNLPHSIADDIGRKQTHMDRNPNACIISSGSSGTT